VESIPFNSDWTELLAAFNAGGVRYLVVGAYAFARYAPPRATSDLDLLIDRNPENAERVFATLTAFGAPLQGVSAQDFSTEGFFYSFGNPPLEIDILTGIGGVTFDEAWDAKDEGELGGVPVSFIGRKEFLQSKRFVGRLQDLADIEAIEKANLD
jgi:hypothetical protein